MTALALMRSGSVLTNSSYRSSTGVQDSRTASRELRDLVDRRIIEQSGTRGSTTYRLSEPGQNEQLAISTANDRSAAETAVLSALAGGDRSRADLERLTGLPAQRVIRALQSLRNDGFVTMKGKPRSRSALWARSTDG